MTESPQDTQSERVECPAANDTPVRWFIAAGLLIGMGIWCFWDAYVRDKHGNRKYPKPTEDSGINEKFTYYFNTGGTFVFSLVGLASLGGGILAMRRSLVADEEGIAYRGADKVRWDQITRMDTSRLQSQHILYLHHGRDERLTLDQYKLKNFRALLTFVEDHVPASDAEAPQGDQPPQPDQQPPEGE